MERPSASRSATTIAAASAFYFAVDSVIGSERPTDVPHHARQSPAGADRRRSARTRRKRSSRRAVSRSTCSARTRCHRRPRAYAFGPIVEFNHIDQEIIAGTVSGELWQGFGAGALTSAFGAEYRNEELRNDANSDLPDPTRIDIVAQYGDAIRRRGRGNGSVRRVRAAVAREQARRAALGRSMRRIAMRATRPPISCARAARRRRISRATSSRRFGIRRHGSGSAAAVLMTCARPGSASCIGRSRSPPGRTSSGKSRIHGGRSRSRAISGSIRERFIFRATLRFGPKRPIRPRSVSC